MNEIPMVAEDVVPAVPRVPKPLSPENQAHRERQALRPTMQWAQMSVLTPEGVVKRPVIHQHPSRRERRVAAALARKTATVARLGARGGKQ